MHSLCSTTIPSPTPKGIFTVPYNKQIYQRVRANYQKPTNRDKKKKKPGRSEERKRNYGEHAASLPPPAAGCMLASANLLDRALLKLIDARARSRVPMHARIRVVFITVYTRAAPPHETERRRVMRACAWVAENRGLLPL